MWLNSFENLSLDDSPSYPKLNRSMSLNEITPRKRIKIEHSVKSNVYPGLSEGTVVRQYSYEELGVVSGSSSVQLSQKFVSELHFDVSEKQKWDDHMKANNHVFRQFKKFVEPDDEAHNSSLKSVKTEKGPVFSELTFCNKAIFAPNSLSSSEVLLTKAMSQKKNYEKRPVKRKRLLRLMPKQLSSLSSESTDGFSNDVKNVVEEKREHHSFMTFSCFLWIILPLLVIILATFGTQFTVHRRTCDAKFDFNAMEYLLSTTIFGQEKAIRKIVNTFKQFYALEEDGLQVIVFTGNTGVGKTFAASLLEELFPWRFNIHHFIMPVDLDRLPSDSLHNYPYCGDHLVILDNLREEDLKGATEIVNYLRKLATQKRVVAILIFKFHKRNSDLSSQIEISKKGNEVQSVLSQFGINSEIIHFKNLEKEDVVQCIKEALSRHWIPVADKIVDAILEQVDFHNEGCKRIASKIAVVNDMWVKNE